MTVRHRSPEFTMVSKPKPQAPRARAVKSPTAASSFSPMPGFATASMARMAAFAMVSAYFMQVNSDSLFSYRSSSRMSEASTTPTGPKAVCRKLMNLAGI